MKNSSILVVILFVGVGAHAQVTQQWVARYHGPNSGTDFARGLAVDGVGNVYATGRSETDYATVSYDSSGSQRWVDRIPGPGGGYTAAGNAIVAGPSGRIYATGSGGHAYVTVAYDTTGNRLWLAEYNGPGANSTATAIAIDGSGNVYVTGGSQNETSGTDYATVAYDQNGSRLWVARYHGPGSDFNSAVAIVVDSSGQRVYVTGSSRNAATTRWEYATVAYDVSGNQLWVARYNGTAGSDSSFANAIALDVAGNIYVTGQDSITTGTLAYDPSGNQLWVNRFDNMGGFDSLSRAIAIDPLGNIIIAGEYNNFGIYYLTVSYDSSGNQSWYNAYAGPITSSQANAIAVDSSGNVYVTGASAASFSRTDYATVAYDVTGSFQLWEARYPSLAGGDAPCCIALDAAGNVYVTGAGQVGTDNYDYLTIKYSQP